MMTIQRLILLLPGLLAVSACASGTRPMLPDGRDRVAANSPARISQFLARMGEESAAQQERTALARQLDAMNRQLAELKTFVLLMQVQSEAKGASLAPATVAGRGPVIPSALTAPDRPSAPAGRSLQMRASEGPPLTPLALSPGEAAVEDTPRLQRTATSSPPAAGEPVRKPNKARPAMALQADPTATGRALERGRQSTTGVDTAVARQVPTDVQPAAPAPAPAPAPAAAEVSTTSVAMTKDATPGQAGSATVPKEADPVAPAKPAPVEQVPIKPEEWVASAGSTLRGELFRWADKAGWKVIYDSKTDYRIVADIPFTGRFDEAVATFVRLYEQAEKPLIVDISMAQRLVWITDRRGQ